MHYRYRQLLCLAACGLLVGSACAESGLTVTPTSRPAPPNGPVVLDIHGPMGTHKLPGTVTLDAATLRALPLRHITTHTPWFDQAMTFSGPFLQEVLDLVKVQGEHLRLTALNDYAVEVPISDLKKYQPVLAWQINGKALSVRDKGPLFLMFPFDSRPELKNDLYYGRAIWQIRTITVK
jgi:hypothetical protein